jgi:hypothetical protein
MSYFPMIQSSIALVENVLTSSIRPESGRADEVSRPLERYGKKIGAALQLKLHHTSQRGQCFQII